jgi:acylphosphatase
MRAKRTSFRCGLEKVLFRLIACLDARDAARGSFALPAYRTCITSRQQALLPRTCPPVARFTRPLSATIFGFVTDPKQARRFIVSGFVQGVGYRYFAQHAAQRLHLSGFVRNLRDGRVEAYAIGTSKQLADFCAMLERGPSAAEVRGVIEEPAEIEQQYASAFVITYDDEARA